MSVLSQLTEYFTFSWRARHPESDLAKTVAIDELHQLQERVTNPRLTVAVSKALANLEQPQELTG